MGLNGDTRPVEPSWTDLNLPPSVLLTVKSLVLPLLFRDRVCVHRYTGRYQTPDNDPILGIHRRRSTEKRGQSTRDSRESDPDGVTCTTGRWGFVPWTADSHGVDVTGVEGGLVGPTGAPEA